MIPGPSTSRRRFAARAYKAILESIGTLNAVTVYNNRRGTGAVNRFAEGFARNACLALVWCDCVPVRAIQLLTAL